MKGFILKSHEAQALAAGKSAVIWRKLSRPLQEQPDGRRSWIVCSTDKAVRDMHCYSWPDPNGFSITDRGREFCEYFRRPFPVGIPLFGKETWQYTPTAAPGQQLQHKASKPQAASYEEWASGGDMWMFNVRWKSSTSMPEWASRITLTLSDMKVRRPCDVTEEEAKAMGVSKYPWMATALNPETMKIETDDRHCRRVFGEIFRTQHGNAAWNLYHFTALATPQPKEA